MVSNVFVGLDLGQTRDYSALVVLEKDDDSYTLRRLERLPLRTPYQEVVAHVRDLLEKPRLRGAVLVVDQSGVGRAVVDLLRDGNLACGKLVPVTITGGTTMTCDTDGWRVGKRDLVMPLVLLLQQRRLIAPRELPLAEVLIQELASFQVRTTASAYETFDAREGEHDDVVLACALAAWWGEYRHPPIPRIEGDLVLNFRRSDPEREHDPFRAMERIWGPMRSWGDF